MWLSLLIVAKNGSKTSQLWIIFVGERDLSIRCSGCRFTS